MPVSFIPTREVDRKSDAELVRLSQQKDSTAFTILVKRHQRSVYNAVYQLSPDGNNSLDITQEVFIRAWRSIHNLRNPRSFRCWLNQIATNLFYDDLRKRPKLSTVSIDDPIDRDDDESVQREIADSSSLPDECYQLNELSGVISEAMSQLPEQFRTAILLREVHGLSYEEIALLTASEMGTVKSRIARARTKIQELLQPYLAATA